ncbi:MAG: nucleoside hydrolase [Bacteroidota bacterium]
MRPLLLLILVLFAACQTKTAPPQAPIKIILDTDMGSDCDDVGALALLHQYASEDKAEILGVIYSSGAVPYGAGVIDAINRYYGQADIPIGANHDPAVGDTVDKMQAEKLAKDTAAYDHQIIHNTDATEQSQLLRRLLHQAEDSSIVYITIGHTKGLYDLLRSGPDTISSDDGLSLVKQKIQKWVALGALNADNQGGYYAKDWNFSFNGTAPFTKYLVDSFPQPSYFVSGGRKVMTGKSLLDTPPGNIVRTAYRDWLWNVEQKILLDQRPSWDLVAVYFAVENPTQYFNILDEGYLDFDPEQGSQWIREASSRPHYFVQQKPGFDEDLAAYLNAMIATE